MARVVFLSCLFPHLSFLSRIFPVTGGVWLRITAFIVDTRYILFESTFNLVMHRSSKRGCWFRGLRESGPLRGAIPKTMEFICTHSVK